MKDTEKVCKNCYWNVACKNGAYCLLRNKKINNENDDCKTFEYRCYVCHKRLNRNARFRKIDNELQRVCEHCLCELLVNDLFDANEEIERLKNNDNVCHKCGEELFNKEMLEENDLFDDDYYNNMDNSLPRDFDKDCDDME